MSAITLTDLKEYLRYESDQTDQDTALGAILAGAQRWVENYTGHIMVQRTVTESPLSFGDFIPLRWKPYVADSAVITYYDADFTEQTFEAFNVIPALGGHRIVPNSDWPTGASGITVAYMAGYADNYDIPEDLTHAMMIYAAMTDSDRGEANSAGWKALDALCLPYRLPVMA